MKKETMLSALRKNERESRKTVPGKIRPGYMILNRPYF